MEDKSVGKVPAEMATVHDIEDSEARLERLGRERPPCFSSCWSELTFCFSIVMSQILAVCPPPLPYLLLLTDKTPRNTTSPAPTSSSQPSSPHWTSRSPLPSGHRPPSL